MAQFSLFGKVREQALFELENVSPFGIYLT